MKLAIITIIVPFVCAVMTTLRLPRPKRTRDCY